VPYFLDSDLSSRSYEIYLPLDDLGRCTQAVANIGQDLMPTEERESIYEVKPTGWQSSLYDFVDGQSLYNRCHLIGFQLTGENANENNLITGTRYMNVQGMLPYENETAKYIQETGNHVLYRVTPIFEGDNLVASGVLMEAQSVEDDALSFCVYCFNVQPGVIIDYATGDNYADDTQEMNETNAETTYILNTNSKKFHLPDCSSVPEIKEKNKKEVTQTRDSLMAQGYDPCARCNP
jgi:DNA-entry nuclease